jgi:hypothetical protein
MKQPVVEATGGTAVRCEGANKSALGITAGHDRVAEAASKRPAAHAPETGLPTAEETRADVHTPWYRGPLMQDYWRDAEDPEHSTIPSCCIAEVARASDAITTIARLVHNSIAEPRMSGAEPLGFAAHTGLLAAMEIIGTYLGDMAESMRARARDIEQLANMRGGGHE